MKTNKNVPKIRFKGFEEEWEEKKLGELGSIITGSTPSTADKTNYNGNYLFVSPADIQDYRYIENTITTLSEKGFRQGRILKEGAILFVSIGSTIGKVAQLKDFATTNQQINALEVSESIDKNFTYALLVNRAKHIKGLAATQAVPIINKTNFSNIDIYLSSNYFEQTLIGNYFQNIDKLIETNQSKLDKLKNIKKACLEKMFPKKGANIPEIRLKGHTEPWEQHILGDLYIFKYGQFNNNPNNGGQYPVYGANGIIGGYSEYNAEDSVVIGHMGEYAGSVLWGRGKHFVTYNGTITIPKQCTVNPIFGYYMLYNLNIKKICGGSGLPFLAYDKLQMMNSIFPVLEKEQRQIAGFLQNIDNLINLSQSKLIKLKNIKKACLEKMFINTEDIV